MNGLMLNPAQLFYPFILALAVGASTASGAAVDLFTLERSMNANQVVYELTPGNAVHPFWRMFAEDGHTEELTGLERSRAYGVNVQAQNESQLQFTLKALSTYPLKVELNPAEGHPVARVRVAGVDRILRRLYIDLAPGFIPSVNTISMETQRTAQGPFEYFVLTPKSGAMLEAPTPCVAHWDTRCH